MFIFVFQMQWVSESFSSQISIVGKRDRIETILSECRNLIPAACSLIIIINEAVRYISNSCPRKTQVSALRNRSCSRKLAG